MIFAQGAKWLVLLLIEGIIQRTIGLLVVAAGP